MAASSDRDRERKLDKIKKCLALAGSSNPHEAEAALRQARKLMEALGLSMDDVEASRVGESYRRTGSGEKRQAPQWVGALASLVAEAFGCTTLMRRGPGGNGVVFVGVEPSPELASYTFEVMHRQLGAARRKFLEENGVAPKRRAPITRRQQGALFIDGWLYAVYQKIKDFAGMDEPTATAVNAYMAISYPDLPESKARRKKAPKLTTAAELDALRQGYAAGNKAQLRRAAGVGASAPLLPGSELKTSTEAQASLF